METTRKTTPLNSWHRTHGANMADFGGFDMPLWYETGVKKEHLAVIRSVGLFDTSHMASVMVTGPGALALLQHTHTRDLQDLKDGRCVYGAILNEAGHVIDDAIVYRFRPDTYMVCVNAGMGPGVTAHFAAHQGDLEVNLTDLSGKLGKVDVQGKNAAKLISRIIAEKDEVFSSMPYFSFKGHFDADDPLSGAVRLTTGTPVLLSRSGYTGEFGFELFVASDAVTALWEELMTVGKDLDVTACGLGARDSLRAGAVLPLSHQDVGHWKFINHPWMFALPLTPDGKGFTKSFLGDAALLDPADTFHTLPFVGDTLRKVGNGPETKVLDDQGEEIGMVLTCATDMAIGRHGDKILSIASPDLPPAFNAKGLSCGFIRVNRPLAAGTRVTLQEKKRKITVTVVTDVRPHRTARKKITNFI